MRWPGALLLVLAAGCGPPVLRNAPRVPAGTAAGIAAGAAAAATLAAPDAAARKAEAQARGEPRDPRGVEVHETVPADVFDRLDARDAGVDGPSAPR